MIDPALLEILVCPETRSSLRLAEPALVEAVNRAVARGALVSRGGQPIAEPIEGGLVREDGRCLYPIRDDIPIMLVEESIALPLPTEQHP
ncbi:MAG: hypothetical protein HY423_02025 [Candidatus Lambdaproteobacteria bacterium]|nr:hypothetical protein [Candidatus Lambdaproteobacteria bacterium]